jgi:molybdopterin converting factor small subunit
MTVSVELFGQLSLPRPRKQTLELEDRATVRAAADLLGLDPEEIGLITINGVQSEMEDSLPPGCRLCFFPYVTGG